VVLDALHSGDALGGNNERPLLLFGQIRRPQMGDAGLDGDSRPA
jgi:hypothetical protein